ncbi:serine-rich adhesin for platelets-like isoform X2 [Argopecten irradians]|uniref:serine-rich adhesin for platelets-like isoform X2 n=1 Tax=Argopecten irradians TaxID=31199 RepID=UPI0037188A4B
MPLPERIVQPVSLGGHPLDVSEAEEGTAHLTVASNSLIGALLQLASLVRHADDLFCDISDECQKVFDRSERISKKLSNIEVAVSKLDAKDVPIPVGDLSQFSQTGDYHVTKHGFDSDLFTKETRSQCIRDQYAQAEVSPSHILRGADIYRKDGLCSSRLFRLWPVLLREPKVKTPDLNLPRKTPSIFTFEKRYKKLQQRPKTIHVTDEQYFTKEEMAREAEAMSESLSQSTSASLISIDTSGQGFERMESLRGSQRSIASKDREAKRKKRRRTVSGVSDHIMKEIEAFERKRKNGYREQPRDYSFDDIDMDGNTIQRDEEMVKYLDEIDAKMEERKEIEHAFRKPKILRLLPCRRSRSLPRCLKLHSMKALTYDRQSLGTEHSSRYEGDSISLASAGSGSSRLSRSTKRSSIISNKIKSLVNGSNIGNKLRPRPKSLDLDAIDFDDETLTSSLAKNKMPSMPDGILSASSRDSSKVGPGSYYNFESESNTLPRRQPKRIEREFTWNAMPKDWTTSVKLREISKRRSKEDRQSSSGNWSGSSSNRHSLDSDVKIESMPSTSQCSLGQDSGRDSPTLEERSRCDTDTTGGYAGDGASTVSDKSSMKDQKGDTDKWLQNLAKRAACREDASSSSAETLNSLTRLTKQNIMALDLMMSPSKRKPAAFFLDDDESVYSVDQEGFYTSFHNDSGLRRSCGTLVDEDMSSPTRDTQSVTSFESVINTSDTDKYAGLKRGASQGGNKVLSKVNPPAPPPRTSSCPRLSPRGQDEENPQPSPDMVSRQDSSSMSESDQESIYMRLKSKTQISSNGIPSICPMSSDEEGAFRRQSGGSVENEDKSNLIAGQEQTLDMNQNLSKVTELTSDSSIFSVSSFDASSKFDTTLNYTDDTLLGTNKSESDFECQTLPRTHHSDKEVTPSFDYTKSWPRSHKKSDNSQTPVSGILKSTDRSLSGPKPNKSLNFSPVINMFNPGTPQAVQMPLPCSPASSEEGNRKMNKQNSINSPDSAYKLAVPITQEKSDNKAGLPMKYQPVIVVKPGQRPGHTSDKKGAYVKLNQASEPSGSHISPYAASTVSKQTPGPYSGTSRSDNLYAISPVKSPSQRMENAADSGYLEMNGNSSIHSMESQVKNSLGIHHGSVLSLESEDSFNFTGSYVSMASPCSSPNLSNLDVPMVTTPTGSMDSLLMEQPSKGFISIDESNLSSTMETVAISTNSFSSFGGSDNDRSFSTFSGPPPKPSMSSTPQTTSQFHPPRHNRSVPHQQQSQRNNRSTPSPQPALPARVPLEPHNRTGAQRQPNYRPQTSSTPQHQRPQKPHYQNNVMKRPENYHPLAQKSTSKSYSSSHLQKSAMPSSRSFPSDMTKYAGTDTSSTESISTRPGRPRANASVRRASAGTPSYNVPPSGSDSDSSSNANGRNDSYRVAMVNPSRNSSYRVAMKESKSCPSLQNSQKVRPSPVLSQSSHSNGPKNGPKNASPVLTQSVYNKGTPSPLPAEYFLPQAEPEDFNRTDSYRFAVRNTHGVVSEDNTGRNSSYRVAVKEMDSMIPDNHMSGVHSVPAGGRDMRRMGITDVDQVKGVSGATKSLRPSESTSSVKLRRPAKTSDVDPISVLSSMNSGSSHKTNKNRHSTSSTYIRFDPIFEDKEDITGSMDSLRDSMGSLKMADSSGEMSFYGADSFYGSGKPKVNALSNGRLPSSSANEKSSSSLFSNVKNFVRQKSSSKNSSAAVIEDDCRFTMV